MSKKEWTIESSLHTLPIPLIVYQDDFPLIPGDYLVSVIVRNRVVSRYTVAETEIPALGDPILDRAFEVAVEWATALAGDERGDAGE